MRYVEADTEFARFAVSSPQEQAELLRTYTAPDLRMRPGNSSCPLH